jgi:very-short-patch-repair endonuclease
MLRLTSGEFRSLIERRLARLEQAKAIIRHRIESGKRWEELLATQLDEAGIAYLREYRFEPERRFRFDFAFPGQDWGLAPCALELDGAVHRIKGRFASDREKGNLAVLRGWRVLHVDRKMVQDGSALALVKQLLARGC